jgi:hypothetical protein
MEGIEGCVVSIKRRLTKVVLFGEDGRDSERTGGIRSEVEMLVCRW